MICKSWNSLAVTVLPSEMARMKIFSMSLRVIALSVAKRVCVSVARSAFCKFRKFEPTVTV